MVGKSHERNAAQRSTMDRAGTTVRGGQARHPLQRDGLPGAGSWQVLRQLRDHDPPLAREITRLDPEHETMHYLVIITEAGERFYEKHRRLYRALYPPRQPEG
ncbi:MAG: hypothetical protein KatS3mg051_1231 [Anaerolineae bacterium]|nr:MAG: hypothetical protein KatS3mg051_1231 [Anaerolineae bacterium]